MFCNCVEDQRKSTRRISKFDVVTSLWSKTSIVVHCTITLLLKSTKRGPYWKANCWTRLSEDKN